MPSGNINKYEKNVAVAIGYPEKCGYSYTAYRYQTEEAAISRAMTEVVDYVKNKGKHVGKNCGARLLVINDKLVVEPEDIPRYFYATYVMLINDSNEGTETKAYGVLTYSGPGEDLPLKLHDDKGKLVCNGRYSLSIMQAFLGTGKMQLNCFDGQLSAKGDFDYKKYKDRQLGVGSVRFSDGTDVKFISNITIDEFEDFRSLIK